jgi:hypothetical protein
MYVLIEVKNEIDDDDPDVQGATYFFKFRQNKKHGNFYEFCSCPALFLEVVGPLIRVCVCCQPLTPFLPLLLMIKVDEVLMSPLAQAVVALRFTLEKIRSFSDKERTTVLSTTSPVYLPYIITLEPCSPIEKSTSVQAD